MKRLIIRLPFLLFIFVCLILLSSCEIINSALLYVGIDSHDYAGEEAIAALDTKDETVTALTETINIITLDSIQLTEFSDGKKVMKLYTDEILSFLLVQRYSKYNSNPALLSQIEKEYPSLYATTVIPADDYDAILQKHFGTGHNITHEDGKLFRYLPKVDMYVTQAQPMENSVTVNVISCEETENTYRMKFTLSANENTSDNYVAVFIKRESSDAYLKILKAETQ